jgi:Meiotically up-regulated gene 113
MKRQYLAFKELVECGLVEKHNDICYTSIETPCLKNRKVRGYVYVLCGYFPDYDKPVKKIGVSYKPMLRYRTITNNCPYPVFIDYIFTTPFSFDIEKHLHRAFKPNRVRNKYCKSGESEWFVGVNDADIVTEFLSFDYNYKAKRQGYSKVEKVDYSSSFSLNLFNKVNFSELVSKIEIEPHSDELELLLLSADVLYREAEKEQDLVLLKGLMSTYEVLEGKEKEETWIIIKGLQAALNFA